MSTTFRSTLNHISFPSTDAPTTAAFFERHLGFSVSAFGRSRILKKDGLDIVIEDASDRAVVWPENFHVGVELPSLEDVRGLRAQMLEAGVPMEAGLLAHERGSRFFCRIPGGVLLEVNTRADAAPAYRATFGR
jgi:catechol 2,3-dioxygenase-like lactoylglutathione lyase family enzyme